jgi:hypothetical protein
MSTTVDEDQGDAIPWAGLGESLIADMRHRELFVYGTREGTVLKLERAWTLEGWEDQPLVEMLTRGPSASLRLEELDDLTGVVTKKTFDLPRGAKAGYALYGFEGALRGFGSALERVAGAKAGFHLLPRLFERVWEAIGGGNPVRVHVYQPFRGSRDAVIRGEAWHAGLPARIPHLSEQKTKPRHQLTGHHVLDGELGMCPECGSSMVKTPGAEREKVCRELVERYQGLDTSFSPEEQELIARATGATTGA